MHKKLQIFLLFFAFLGIIQSVKSSDIVLPKNILSGLELMQGYVVIRNNTNNGFLVAGSTPSVDGMRIHLIDIHDTGAIIWSKYISDRTPSTSIYFTSIDSKQANNGYILCGYMFENSSPGVPISVVIDVNNIGTVQKVQRLNIPGVLVFAKTIPNGYIFSGYLGNDTTLYTQKRDGYLIKLDDTLAFSWACKINHIDIPNDVFANRFDVVNGAEIIIDEVNKDTTYFIHGNYTRKGVLGSTVPAIFCAMLDKNGNLFNNFSLEGNFTSNSCTYDKIEKRIWLVGNKTFDIGSGSSFGMLFKIDYENGIIESSKKIYGLESEIEGMIPQMLCFHNIELLEDTLHIFGYIRKMSLGNNQLEDPNLSFKISFPKDSIHQYESDFYQSNTLMHTGYLAMFQGTLSSNYYDEMSLPVGKTPVFYTPKIGTTFKKSNGTNCFGVVNYIQNGSNGLFSLTLTNNSANGTCGQLKMYLKIIEESLRPGSMLIFEKSFMPLNIYNLENNNALFDIMYCPGG
jgi:hypothetical protein